MFAIEGEKRESEGEAAETDGGKSLQSGMIICTCQIQRFVMQGLGYSQHASFRAELLLVIIVVYFSAVRVRRCCTMNTR